MYVKLKQYLKRLIRKLFSCDACFIFMLLNGILNHYFPSTYFINLCICFIVSLFYKKYQNFFARKKLIQKHTKKNKGKK